MHSHPSHQPAMDSRPSAPSRPQTGSVIDDLPSWLKSLEISMKYLFCGVAGLSLFAYGWMVYTQEQWRINHQQLQKLKNQEHQLAITSARIKSQLAQNAEKTQSGLVSPEPADFLYVPATTQVTSKPAIKLPPVKAVPLPGPVGY